MSFRTNTTTTPTRVLGSPGGILAPHDRLPEPALDACPLRSRRTGQRLTRLRQRGADQSGQALVELAMVLPILLLLLFAIIDFARAYNQANETTHIANIAARWAAVGAWPGSSGQSLCDYVETDPSTGPLNGKFAISVTVPSTVGSALTVIVTKNHDWLGPLQGFFPSATTTLTSKVTMRVENAPSGGFSCTAGNAADT